MKTKDSMESAFQCKVLIFNIYTSLSAVSHAKDVPARIRHDAPMALNAFGNIAHQS